MLHGRTEFIEKYLETIGELCQRGFAVWTMDWRGQGLSSRAPGLDDRQKGYVASFDEYLEDLDALLRDVVPDDRTGIRLLLGHSMGAHVGLRYVHRKPDAFDGAVLTAPMIDVVDNAVVRALMHGLVGLAGRLGLGRSYLPGARNFGARARDFSRNVLTSDRARFDRMLQAMDANPDVVVAGPTIGWARAALGSIRALRQASMVAPTPTPILIVGGGADQVVSNRAQTSLCARLPRASRVEIPGARHEILIERDELRRQFWEAFDGFVAPLITPS